MKTYNFIICYDISDKKRLSKLAKLLEQCSIRIQKSIFFYESGLDSELKDLTNNIENIISKDEDDIRIYKIDINCSLSINGAIDLQKPNLIGDICNAKYI